jgi:hypothetical protein
MGHPGIYAINTQILVLAGDSKNKDSDPPVSLHVDRKRKMGLPVVLEFRVG